MLKAISKNLLLNLLGCGKMYVGVRSVVTSRVELRRFAMGNQTMLFGKEIQLGRLSVLGDPLEKINALIDWEMFRSPIRERIRNADYSRGGRPPLDEILMFKIMLLQDWNTVSDDQTEYLVNCRLDWQRFLGMELGEKAPDSKSVWLFKERLGAEGVRALFDVFNAHLQSLGLLTREGSLIDSTFVEVPRQ